MNKKLRYLILGFCFLIFCILAPLLVLFVRGVTYEDIGGKPSKTGILAVETEPDDVEILLDGKLTTTTPASVRFLKPGDYTILLRKDGYFDWQKKLTVTAERVTWAHPNPNKIFMLKNHAQPELITTSAHSFVMFGSNKLAYTTGKNVVLLSGNAFAETQTVPVPEPLPELYPSPGNEWILLRGKKSTYVLDTRSLQLTDATTFIPTTSNIRFVSDTDLLVLSAGVLERINLQTQSKQVLFTNVQSFTVADDRVYILQQTNTGATLLSALLEAPQNTQVILSEVPTFNQAQIFVTFRREALLLADGTLYRISSTLEELISNIQNATFDQPSSSLVFTVPGELNYYNFDDNKIKLISRSNEPFTNVVLRRDLGYAFYFHQGALQAIELDDRDRQNTYTIASIVKPQLFYFANDKTIIFQDNENLLTIAVR